MVYCIDVSVQMQSILTHYLPLILFCSIFSLSFRHSTFSDHQVWKSRFFILICLVLLLHNVFCSACKGFFYTDTSPTLSTKRISQIEYIKQTVLFIIRSFHTCLLHHRCKGKCFFVENDYLIFENLGICMRWNRTSW